MRDDVYGAQAYARDPADSPVTRGSDSDAMQLTQLLPANPGNGWGTTYYPVYTDQGDIGAVIPGTLTSQQVRLVDPQTGATLASGTGNDGAQQIATLANALGKQLGGKAAYNIQVEFQPGQFTTVGGDDINHPHANLLKTLVKIAGPILGSAIPGLGPILGAALGGFGSTLATGGDLQSALLSALTSGVGNSLGGAFSHLLGGPLGSSVNPLGLPAAFAGSNPLGGLFGHLSDVLTGAGGVAGGVAGAAGSSGGLLSALSFAGQGVNDALGGAISPLVVNGAASGLGAGLSGALGTALGALSPGMFTSAQTPGDPTDISGIKVTPPSQSPAVVPGLPTLDSAPTDVSGVEVTAPDKDPAPVIGLPTPAATTGTVPQKSLMDELLSRQNLNDLAGQTAGGLTADAGVYGLAQLLGLFNGPSGGSGGLDGSNLTAPGIDQAVDPTAPGGLPAGGGALPPASAGTTPAPPGGGISPGASVGDQTGGVLNQVLGLANIGGGGGGATSPLAAAPNFNLRGSTAPDIYPWRKALPSHYGA